MTYILEVELRYESKQYIESYAWRVFDLHVMYTYHYIDSTKEIFLHQVNTVICFVST
jgi:hypothetical protein